MDQTVLPGWMIYIYCGPILSFFRSWKHVCQRGLLPHYKPIKRTRAVASPNQSLIYLHHHQKKMFLHLLLQQHRVQSWLQCKYIQSSGFWWCHPSGILEEKKSSYIPWVVIYIGISWNWSFWLVCFQPYLASCGICWLYPILLFPTENVTHAILYVHKMLWHQKLYCCLLYSVDWYSHLPENLAPQI